MPFTGLTVTCTEAGFAVSPPGAERVNPTTDAASMQQHITARPMQALLLLLIASTAKTAAARKAAIEITANNIFMRI